jgi:hypothetical protein
VTGTIEGVPVDERFESGPGRFNDVQSAQPLQFPDRVPDAAESLALIQAARDEAASARMLGLAGLAAGLAGAAAAGSVLLASRRRSEERLIHRGVVGRPTP